MGNLPASEFGHNAAIRTALKLRGIYPCSINLAFKPLFWALMSYNYVSIKDHKDHSTTAALTVSIWYSPGELPGPTPPCTCEEYIVIWLCIDQRYSR